MNDIKLFEQKLGEKSKVAILRVENFVGGIGHEHAMNALNKAIGEYWGDSKANLFTDITFMNPYDKVLITGMDTLDFHNYDTYMKTEDKSKCKCQKCRKRKH